MIFNCYREAPRVLLHPETATQIWHSEEKGGHAGVFCVRYQSQGQMVQGW